MKSWRDVSSNDVCDEIYQKAADMVSFEEISLPRIVKHETMRSNVPAESQQFSGHAEAVMRLSSLLLANVVIANFCEVKLAVNLFLPLLQAALIKVKAQLLLEAKVLSKSF